MKKLFITLIFFSSLLLTNCEKEDSANVSRVTDYPIVKVLGDATVFIPQGGVFNDQGAIALEGDDEIAYTSSAKGKYRGMTNVDTSITDEYTVAYTAINKDGFKSSSTRKVIVYKTGNLVDSIEGVYTCTISRDGIIPSNDYEDIKYIYIWKNSNGDYQISDAFGGWYSNGRGLGVTYITPGGTIAGDIATNTFTFPGNPLTNSSFGGVANIVDLNVDAASKTLVLTCNWAAPTEYVFVATLTQVQL